MTTHNTQHNNEGFEFAQSSPRYGMDTLDTLNLKPKRSGRNKFFDFKGYMFKSKMAWGFKRNLLEWIVLLTFSSMLISVTTSIGMSDTLSRAASVNLIIAKIFIYGWIFSYIPRSIRSLMNALVGFNSGKHSDNYYLIVNAISAVNFIMYFLIVLIVYH